MDDRPIRRVRRILSNLHRVADDDKATALARRFMDLTPFVGYRCLAALGRPRRVLVVNMNWDPLLLAVCDRLGVPCVNFDLRDAVTRPDLSEMAAFTGVIDVHLHGDLADPRHGPADIRWPTNDEVELLRGLHDGARRLYAGLSLTVDHDVAYLGQQLDDGLDGRVFAFFRDDSDDPSGIATRVSSLGARYPAFAQHPDVDFDKIMLAVTDALAPEDGKWGVKGRHLRLPSLEEIVLPHVDVLGPALDDRCAILVGEASIGKTTATQLVGYLHEVLADGGAETRYFDTQSALAALGAPDQENPADLLVLESPFGDEENPVVVPTLMEQISVWTGMSDSPRLLITSRVGAYEQSPLSAASYTASNPSPAAWYGLEDLRRFARLQPEGDERLVARVQPTWLDTPARILEAVAGVEPPRNTEPAERERSAILERQSLLDRDPDLGLLCAAARLQEFGGEPLGESMFRTLLGGNLPKGAGAHLMVHYYEWDGRRRLRLAHPLDRSAVDVWIPTHLDEVGALLANPLSPRVLKDGWDAWTMCDDVRQGRFELVRARDPNVIGQHLSAMLDVRPDAQVLQLLADATLDEWSAHIWPIRSCGSGLSCPSVTGTKCSTSCSTTRSHSARTGSSRPVCICVRRRPQGWSTSSERGSGSSWSMGPGPSKWLWRSMASPGACRRTRDGCASGHERRCDATRRSAARCRLLPHITPAASARSGWFIVSPELELNRLPRAQGSSQSGW